MILYILLKSLWLQAFMTFLCDRGKPRKPRKLRRTMLLEIRQSDSREGGEHESHCHSPWKMPRRLLGFLRMIRLRRTWNVISGVRLELTGPCKVGGSFGKRGGVGSARRPKPQRDSTQGKNSGSADTSHDIARCPRLVDSSRWDDTDITKHAGLQPSNVTSIS